MTCHLLRFLTTTPSLCYCLWYQPTSLWELDNLTIGTIPMTFPINTFKQSFDRGIEHHSLNTRVVISIPIGTRTSVIEQVFLTYFDPFEWKAIHCIGVILRYWLSLSQDILVRILGLLLVTSCFV